MIEYLKNLIDPARAATRQPLELTIDGDAALDIRQLLDQLEDNEGHKMENEYRLWDYIESNYPVCRGGQWKVGAHRGAQVKIIEVL